MAAEPCVVQGIDARCGTSVVPENRSEPNGRTIGLHVVVLPAFSKPSRQEAVTYLAGGPGDAATTAAATLSRQWGPLNANRDILLADQRGTGRSSPRGSDVTPVRDADGNGRPRRGTGGARLSAARRDLRLVRRDRRAGLPEAPSLLGADGGAGWERRFGELVQAWNAEPVPMSGDQLASVVHGMLLDLANAVSIPLVVSRVAKGDYRPLQRAGPGDVGADLRLMSSIWCNEPWTGLDAKGPWGTDLDSYTTAQIAALRRACSSVPRRAEPRSLWGLPTSSRVPVLAVAGGADPQDPVANLSDLKRHFPDSRIVVLPHIGHPGRVGGCFDQIMADLVERGTTKGLDTTLCDAAVVVPPFELPD